jgi:hypothetical protein
MTTTPLGTWLVYARPDDPYTDHVGRVIGDEGDNADEMDYGDDVGFVTLEFPIAMRGSDGRRIQYYTVKRSACRLADAYDVTALVDECHTAIVEAERVRWEHQQLLASLPQHVD